MAPVWSLPLVRLMFNFSACFSHLGLGRSCRKTCSSLQRSTTSPALALFMLGILNSFPSYCLARVSFPPPLALPYVTASIISLLVSRRSTLPDCVLQKVPKITSSKRLLLISFPLFPTLPFPGYFRFLAQVVHGPRVLIPLPFPPISWQELPSSLWLVSFLNEAWILLPSDDDFCTFSTPLGRQVVLAGHLPRALLPS